MKRLLFFFLIVALFCFSIEQNNAHVFEEEDPLLQFKISLPKIQWPKVRKGIEKAWNEVKNDARKANKFLKDNGIYDVALKVIKIAGQEAAVAGCCAVEIPFIICQEMVYLVSRNI